MCIGLNRRSVPTGGFGLHHVKDGMMNRVAVKPEMVGSFQQSPENKEGSKHHITVQHNYHDHSGEVEFESKHTPARGGVVTPFPLKLHSMLEAVEQAGLEHIVSWQPHGRCFIVHDQQEMVNILVKYFKVSKVSSFQRQLNLYGFQRLTKGRDKGGYYHELFLRGKVFLAQNIHRIKVKGTKIRARSNPEQEPNFYALPWVLPQNDSMEPSPFKPDRQPAHTMMKNQELSAADMQALEPVPLASIWDIETTPIEPIPQSMWEEEDILTSDADAFFEDFDFPQNNKSLDNIEDDSVFGDILEQIVGA
eukprot:scaffold7330_cov146-Cylindrotheca_fusiformis.AAC.12